MANVEHLLQLSDEYQVVELIFNPCVRFLEDQPKTKENVMKILALAELYNLEKVSQDCNNLLGEMRLEPLSETVHFEDLDREKLQHFLMQRIERLETLLDEVYPQFIGLMVYCFQLWHEGKIGHQLSFCTSHYDHIGRATLYRGDIGKWFGECETCKGMLKTLAYYFQHTFYSGKPKHKQNSYVCLDDNLPDVIL